MFAKAAVGGDMYRVPIARQKIRRGWTLDSSILMRLLLMRGQSDTPNGICRFEAVQFIDERLRVAVVYAKERIRRI
jgi:hypothetical protein